MNGMRRREILACMDALALEIAGKIADYKRAQVDLENLRAQVKPAENLPRNFDTHELVSQRLGGRRRTA